MSLPHSWEDSIRKYDAAVFDWLGGLHVDYGDIAGTPRVDFPILRVMAAPHRAIANSWDMLVRMGWIAGDTDMQKRVLAEADWPVLPLPICTIDRDFPVFSPELAGSFHTINKWFVDPVTGGYIQVPYPAHMLTTYRFTFWCTKKFTEAYIAEWFYTRFGAIGAGPQEVYLSVPHDWPFGTQLHAMRWIGTADLSDLEGENPRYIRMQASVILRTWFMRGSLPTAPRAEPVHTIHRQAFSTTELAPTAAWWGSYNLWQRQGTAEQIAAAWPRESGTVLEHAALGDNDEPIVVGGPGSGSVVVTGMSGGSSTTPSAGTVRFATVNGQPANPVAHTTIAVNNGTITETFELVSGLPADPAGTGNIPVTRGPTASDTMSNLLDAINDADFSISASTVTEVAPYGDEGLSVDVTTDNDRVGLVTVGTALYTDEQFEIVSIAGLFEVTGGSVMLGLEGGTGDPRTGTPPAVNNPRWRFSVPVGENRLHAFAIVDGDRFTYYVAGQGTAAHADLSSINVRHVEDGSRIAETQIVDAGSYWQYRWEGLEEGRAYLLVVLTGSSSTGTVSFDDDAGTATFSRTQDLFAGMLGVVGLIQPNATSAAVRVPKTATVTGAWAVAFDGPFTGCTLPP